MSSNAYLLSNSQSPALNALQVKSDAFSEFSYKMMRSLGANIAKQRREIKFTPVIGGTSSIDLLKYGLVYNVYLKVVMTDTSAAPDHAFPLGGVPHLLRSVVLSSHSRVLERLDRAQIINHILEKANSENASILSYTGFNAVTAAAEHTFYIPLPFSFFSGMSKVKDANHLQNLNIAVQFANAAELLAIKSAGADPTKLNFGECALVQNYYEMDQASTNKLFEMTYSKAGSAPTNQLYTQSYAEPLFTKAAVASGDVVTVAIPINTKNVVVRSFISVRCIGKKESELSPINKVVLNLNGVEYYSAETAAMNFERIMTSDHYHRIQTGATTAAFYNMQDFDYRLIDVPACDKFSGGLSIKNTSNAEYLVTFTANHASDIQIRVVHEVLNIVQISKADGSMTSVLSI